VETEKEEGPQVKPTVGRIVHYQAYGTPGGEFKSQPRAAIVAETHEDAGDGECTVVVLNPSGLFFNRVKHAPNDVPTPGHWNWPPRE
jgi:hypothetical protein